MKRWTLTITADEASLLQQALEAYCKVRQDFRGSIAQGWEIYPAVYAQCRAEEDRADDLFRAIGRGERAATAHV